jgi:hypothetical protein
MMGMMGREKETDGMRERQRKRDKEGENRREEETREREKERERERERQVPLLDVTDSDLGPDRGPDAPLRLSTVADGGVSGGGASSAANRPADAWTGSPPPRRALPNEPASIAGNGEAGAGAVVGGALQGAGGLGRGPGHQRGSATHDTNRRRAAEAMGRDRSVWILFSARPLSAALRKGWFQVISVAIVIAPLMEGAVNFADVVTQRQPAGRLFRLTLDGPGHAFVACAAAVGGYLCGGGPEAAGGGGSRLVAGSLRPLYRGRSGAAGAVGAGTAGGAAAYNLSMAGLSVVMAFEEAVAVNGFGCGAPSDLLDFVDLGSRKVIVGSCEEEALFSRDPASSAHRIQGWTGLLDCETVHRPGRTGLLERL